MSDTQPTTQDYTPCQAVQPYGDLPSVFDTSNSFDLKLAFFQLKSKLHSTELTHLQQTQDLKLSHFKEKELMKEDFEDRLRRLMELEKEAEVDEEVKVLKRQLIEAKIEALQEVREMRDVIDGLEKRVGELVREKGELEEKLQNFTFSHIETINTSNIDKFSHQYLRQNVSFGPNLSEVRCKSQAKQIIDFKILQRQYQQENVRLKREIQELKMGQGSLIKSYDELDSIRNELEEVKSLNNQLSSQLEQARAIIGEQEIIRVQTLKRIQELQSQKHTVDKNIILINEENQNMTRQISNLRRDIQQYKSEREKSKTEKQGLKNQIQTLQQDNKQNSDKLSKIEQQKKQLLLQINSLKDQISQKSIQINKHTRQLEKQAEQNKHLQQQMSYLQKSKTNSREMQQSVSLLQQKLRTLQNLLAFKEQIILSLKADSERLLEFLSTVRNTSKNHSQETKFYHQQSRKETENCKQQITKLSKINNSLKEQTQVLKSTIKLLKSQAQKASQSFLTEVSNLRQEIKAKDHELYELKEKYFAEKVQLEHQVSQAAVEITKSFTELSKFKQQNVYELANKDKQIFSIKQQNMKLINQIKTLSEEMKNTKQCSEILRKDCQKMKTQAMDCSEKLRDVSQKYISLMAKYRQAEKQIQQGANNFEQMKTKLNDQSAEKANSYEKQLFALRSEIHALKQKLLQQKNQRQFKSNKQSDEIKRLLEKTKNQLSQLQKKQNQSKNQLLQQKQVAINSLTNQLEQLTIQNDHLKFKIRQLQQNNLETLLSHNSKKLHRSEMFLKPSLQTPRTSIAPLLTPSARKETYQSTSFENFDKKTQNGEATEQIDRLRKARDRAEDDSRQIAMELYRIRKDYDHQILSLQQQMQILRQSFIEKSDILTKSQFESTSNQSRATPSFFLTHQQTKPRSQTQYTYQDSSFKKPTRQHTTTTECRWTTMTDSSWDKAKQRTQWELSTIVCPKPTNQKRQKR